MPTGDPPDFVAARDHVLRQVVTFVRTLRAEGATVPANASLDATRALVEVGFDDRERVRAALRATLLSDRRDEDVFETHFPAFWYRLRTGLEATATADDVGDRAGGTGGRYAREGAAVGDEAAPTSSLEDEGAGTESSASGDEVRSRHLVDHGADSDRELDDGRTRTGTFTPAGRGTGVADVPSVELDPASLRRVVRALATVTGRRWSSSRLGDAVDARRALRESVATGGVPLTLPSRERAPSELRCTVLVDVSQSVLDTLDRGFLLAFLDGLVDESRSARVFFFDTDIREVTDVFERASGDPATALASAEVEWGGGTKIGASLATLRSRWPDAIDRRTVTVVVSDGLDVGDVDVLEDGIVWLSRRSRAVLWFNPLAASPKYEPTCRGMATARPYVDGLFAFAGPDDLSDIARQLERHGPHGPVGYEHDFRERRGESS